MKAACSLLEEKYTNQVYM